MGFARRKRKQAHTTFVRRKQNQTIAADVMNGQAAGRTINEPFLARKIQRINRARRSAGYGREPTLFAVRAPRQPLNAGKKRRARFAISMHIENDDATIVAALHVIG